MEVLVNGVVRKNSKLAACGVCGCRSNLEMFHNGAWMLLCPGYNTYPQEHERLRRLIMEAEYTPSNTLRGMFKVEINQTRMMKFSRIPPYNQ